MVKTRHTLATLCAGALIASTLALSGFQATGKSDPWTVSDLLDGPLRVPDDVALQGQLEEALDFRIREDHDVLLNAWEPGELITNARATQDLLEFRDYGNDALFVFGDELFEYAFRPEDGLGNGLAMGDTPFAGPLPRPNRRRAHVGAFGGPDAFSCASCHFVGGPDGAGTATQNAIFFSTDGDRTLSAESRNPPHLLGLGPVEALAREMTRDLLAQRREALDQAQRSGTPVEVALETKGVGFGRLVALPGGDLDLSLLEGVDPDLVIKPFGWKGHQATIRAMSQESFRIHMGLVSTDVQRRIKEGALSPTAYGDGEWFDIDRDGVGLEIDDGMLTTMVAYLAQLESPAMRPPHTPRLQAAFATGQALFEQVGCAECHRPALELRDTILETGGHDTEPVFIDVAREGEYPKPEPKDGFETAFIVHLYSDLKRHDMGPELASSVGQANIPATHFLTRSLWGLAETSPYLHDGRAPTLHEAIVAHGGEALESRQAYEARSSEERGALQVFLLSLSRTPAVFIP